MKPVRKAVRTFLLEEDKILAIKYITNDDKQDFYDIPGGKIEDGETREQTAIREFKEEAARRNDQENQVWQFRFF